MEEKIKLEDLVSCINICVRDTKEANLLSYVSLNGISILILKTQNSEEYTVKKRNLIKKLSVEFNPNLGRLRKLISVWIRAIVANGYYVKICEIESVSRTAVGVSEAFGQVPFEVGLSFDPVLNVPFIPGSTLKGALRHSLRELVEHRCNSSGARVKPEDVVNEIFGSQRKTGLVGVTDAYPVSLSNDGRLFEPDVVTPHYPRAETELDVKPTPVPFLTIAPGVRFRFLLFFNKKIYGEAGRRVGTVADKELGSRPIDDILGYAVHYGGELSEVLKRSGGVSINIVPWVDRAVLYAFAKGVGAKTSLGYSRFRVVLYRACESRVGA